MSSLRTSPAAASTWHDLSHPLREGMPRIASFPSPVIRQIMSMPADPMNVTAVELCCHVGTHIDAPVHFIEGAEAIDELELDRFHGPAVVVAAPAADRGLIDAEVFASAPAAIRPGDIVFVSTRWSRFFGEARYDRHPSLTVDAARWLVERQVKLVGFDFATPDIALDQRTPGFTWPVHRELLGAGVLVAEHLRGLESLEGCRVEAMCLPIDVQGADGAPARIVARELAETESTEMNGKGPDPL